MQYFINLDGVIRPEQILHMYKVTCAGMQATYILYFYEKPGYWAIYSCVPVDLYTESVEEFPDDV
jgi:hypothetical protein